MIKPADENSPFADVKLDGTLKNDGGSIGFQRVVNERGKDVTDYNRGYREGYEAARKDLRDEIAMRAILRPTSFPANLYQCLRWAFGMTYRVSNQCYDQKAKEAYKIADALLKEGQADE